MDKSEYKIKQREYLAQTIQKIKNDNFITDSDYNNILSKIKKKEKKIIKRKNLKINDNLSKEIPDLTPKNTKSTVNYEKSKSIFLL